MHGLEVQGLSLQSYALQVVDRIALQKVETLQSSCIVYLIEIYKRRSYELLAKLFLYPVVRRVQCVSVEALSPSAKDTTITLSTMLITPFKVFVLPTEMNVLQS